MHARLWVADDVRLGSSSGGSSPAASPSGPSDSDGGSTSTDEHCPDDPRESRRHFSRFRPTSPSSCSPLCGDDYKHLQRMALLLPAFSSTAAARAGALRQWIAGFDVGWVLDMGRGSGTDHGLPRREVGRRIRAWAQALGAMDRVFRGRHLEVRSPASDAAAAELAGESVGVMLRLTGTVATLASSPSKLLAALDAYAAVSEACPALARTFSWAPSHPVPAAADAALADLLDASRRCVRDLRGFIRAPQYPWRMPQGGEEHPSVGFWMGYLRCMLRNRVPLYFVLAGGDQDEGGLVMELIACLEAALEDKSAALAFPGLRQLFMLNNTSAIVRCAARADAIGMLLSPGWAGAREERMEGYIRDYLRVSWAPVVSRLGGKPGAMNALRRRHPLSAFHSAFQNASSMQRGWKVPSPVLRGDLRMAVSETVVPAYRRYLDSHPEVDVPAGRGAEELRRHLSELFEG
ncbi:exocyst complex component EXO70A1-like [Triticum dicoccoides]|uniref:exocyst complex component EXO70A1-like n=1 Tax=Triticum dicoccoides TaxID=85692 RepID=UPI001891ECC2|nr:exocyst complex component EXO70A1-like [Triticum dicoccoides]